jgi:hypothetical protein
VEKDTPYGPAVSIHNLEDLHRVIGLHLITYKSQLSPVEIRFLRTEDPICWTTVSDGEKVICRMGAVVELRVG